MVGIHQNMSLAPDDVKIGEAARWWLATVWLSLMFVANLIAALASIAALAGYSHPQMTTSSVVFSAVGACAQIVFILAIFRWHRWGWQGLLAFAVMAFYVNVVIRHDILLAVSGVAGVGVCYLVLKRGGRTAIWPRLR